MRLRLGITESIPLSDMKEALDAALEASVASQVPLIRRGRVPTFAKGLRRFGIRWQPEPPGDEHFDSAATVIRRGWGDCDDLAPWHAASLRAQGTDPDARAVVKKSGPSRWHAIVQRSDGSYEDPSAAAGMYEWKKRNPGVLSGAAAPLWRVMFPGRAGVAVHPFARSAYAARVDVPDHGYPFTWSCVSCSPSKRRAVSGAICGALDVVDCAGDASDADIAHLEGMLELVNGAHPEDVADILHAVYGPSAVGFLPALLPAAASLAAPLLKSFGGGGGGSAPTPSAALSQAPSMGPGTTMMMPGGTTIVRF